ncbi:7851_t:CDS:1, partial [Cetraspora pellucida]
NVVAYFKDYKVKARKQHISDANTQKRLKFELNIWNLAVIDNTDFKEKTFVTSNLFNDTRNTAHAILCIVFQFKIPKIDITTISVTDVLYVNLCEKSTFIKQ